jgi:hypothetical protein
VSAQAESLIVGPYPVVPYRAAYDPMAVRTGVYRYIAVAAAAALLLLRHSLWAVQGGTALYSTTLPPNSRPLRIENWNCQECAMCAQ